MSSPVSRSLHVSKAAPTPGRLDGFRGFEHLGENSGPHGLSKGKFKVSDCSALLAKYSFSQRDAAKEEGVQRDSASTTARPLTHPGVKGELATGA